MSQYRYRYSTPMSRVLTRLVGPDPDPRVRIEAWDGSSVGDNSAATTIRVKSPDAVSRVVTAPGELGFARAYVAGDIEVEGSIFDALGLRRVIPELRVTPGLWLDLVRVIGVGNLRRLPPPAEEAHLAGHRHGRGRDRQAVSHHYDVSNRFYEIVLGPSMTYSCGLWGSPSPVGTLEDAQRNKMELICQKLGLEPGMRLLDVGCGWGSMARHAVREHGVEAVGITLSQEQAGWARAQNDREGLGSRVAIRVQDYRDIHDGPFDAVCSIGMFEHVGAAHLDEYFHQLRDLVAPGRRVLNHGIARPPGGRPRLARRGFTDRYVFPDGELHEVGSVISRMQNAGLEVRHSENLREHYALTLRAWVENLEDNWDDVVREIGIHKARIWRLYMAGSALGFEEGRIRIHQILATRPNVRSLRDTDSMPMRPDWSAMPSAHSDTRAPVTA